MNKRNKATEYLMPAIVAGTLFMIILAINGLWPFGRATIDYYDMAQWADPFYYHNFDQLRGLKSFVYDWYSGLGREIPGLCEPSVFDVLLFFIPRNMILECMSFMMMIKIMACAFTMGIFLKYVNDRLPFMFRVMISAGYGLCGFVIVNYTIPQWIDLAAFVPLVLLFAQRSLREGKILGLSLSIVPIMILDYYFGIQTLMFVFLFGGAYVLCFGSFRRKTDDVPGLMYSRFVAGIIAGLCMSSFSWLPDLMFSLSSARFGNGMSDRSVIGMYLSLLEKVQPAYLSRWFSLLGLSFAAALVARESVICIGRRQYRRVIFAALCVFMTTSQLFIESIHLILHFGSYVDYPVRNGFMIYCIMAGLAGGMYDHEEMVPDQPRKTHPAKIVLGLLFAGIVITSFRIWYLSADGITDHTVLLVTMFMMTVFALIHFAITYIAGGRHSDLCPYLWIAEIVIFGTIMIGKPLYDSPYGNDPEQEGEYIRISDQLTEGFGERLATGSDAATCRIKNPDTSLNANYGEIMRRETLSGWTNFASPEQINGAVSLGYSNQFTRLLDSGGNIFSDTMLHITDVVSHERMDDRLYEEVAKTTVVTDHMTGKTQDYFLYRNRFEMPFAIPVKYLPDLSKNSGDIAGLINDYAKAMGFGEDIASYVKGPDREQSQNDHMAGQFEIGVSGRKALYYTGDCFDTDHYNTRISVNGSGITVPSIGENDNMLFPAHFNNNTVYLGSFENEDVSVAIDMDISDPSTVYKYRIYEIDLDAFRRLCDSMPKEIRVIQGKRSLDINLGETAEDRAGILLPVSYSTGWSATVDGRKTDVQNANGLFMFVETKPGDIEIKMSYFPPYMKAGIVIALVTAGCLVLLLLFDKGKKVSPIAADPILGKIYAAGFGIAFIVIYVIPVVYALISRMT